MRGIIALVVGSMISTTLWGVEFRYEEKNNALTLWGDEKAWLETLPLHFDRSTRDETGKVFTHLFDFKGKAPITKGSGGRYPHHRGLFIGWNRVLVGEKIYDFWGMSNTWQEHVAWNNVEANENGAVQSETIRWYGEEGTPILEEVRTIATTSGPENIRLLDIETTLKALDQNIQLRGDLHHAGVQIRMDNEVNDHERSTNVILPQEALRGDDDRVDNAFWVCCSPVIRNVRYFLVHMTPPSHPNATPVYSIRPYGRFGVFFETDLFPKEPKTFRFRVAVSQTPLDRTACERLYAQYRESLQKPDMPTPVALAPVLQETQKEKGVKTVEPLSTKPVHPVKTEPKAESPAPAKSEPPVHAKAEPSAHAKAESPAPAKSEPPVHAKSEPSAHAKAASPAPAKSEPPVHGKSEPSAHAKAESPAPAKSEPPVHAKSEPSAHAKAESMLAKAEPVEIPKASKTVTAPSTETTKPVKAGVPQTTHETAAPPAPHKPSPPAASHESTPAAVSHEPSAPKAEDLGAPERVLQWLKDGNTRFSTGKSTYPDLSLERRKETAEKGQHPLAVIVGCSDSRAPVEVVFDWGIGDLFVVRVAGNVCDTDEIASIEYAAGHLKTPLIVVLGHTKCGAVTAVATHAEVGGNIPKLVDNIQPAVESVTKNQPTLAGDALITAAIKANIWQSIQDLLTRSEEIRALIREGKLKVIGGMYHLDDGTIEWLGSHPKEKEWLAHEKK